MSFLNKKEQVLDIELTQLGKYQLAKGNFKPVYYAFSDDEVLYDLTYAGSGSEVNRETSNRIQKDTQRVKAFYEHDGAETRILSLNDHRIFKIRGHEEVARKVGRKEEYPVGQIYSNDTVEDEKMGSDDRNLVRNFIGNSTNGERGIPSWDVELLLDGNMNLFHFSSSSPNVGIQRPVITMEERNTMVAKKTLLSNPAINMSQELFSQLYTGLEKSIAFADNISMTVEDDSLIFSIAEQNVDYLRDNFEFELYVHEGYDEIRGTDKKHERLRRLYFSNKEKFFSKEEMVSSYFECLTDHGLADLYGFDMRGFNRDKIKTRFKKLIQETESLKRAQGQSSVFDLEALQQTTIYRMGDISDVCDDTGEGN